MSEPTRVALCMTDAGERSLALTLPDGDAGTDATVMVMRAVAEHAARSSPAVQALARDLSKGRGARAHLGARWFEWAKRNVEFKRDPWQIERVPHPEKFLRLSQTPAGKIAGDCDDLATLGVAVLLAGRKSAAFVVMNRPNATRFQHVLCAEAGGWFHDVPWRLHDNQQPDRFFPIDPQETELPGVLPGPVGRFRVYPCPAIG
ncbi:MAG: hypothetical protein KF768_13475 [Phycisphaeraceae bacterium]|nr:hypothetical protein [Phycisphaeraceae bacterium]